MVTRGLFAVAKLLVDKAGKEIKSNQITFITFWQP